MRHELEPEILQIFTNSYKNDLYGLLGMPHVIFWQDPEL